LNSKFAKYIECIHLNVMKKRGAWGFGFEIKDK
jgi:hypothetical protein